MEKTKSKYICSGCKFHDTDQLGDIVCKNPESPYYKEFVESSVEQLEQCEHFQ